jgi:hypothetical protein
VTWTTLVISGFAAHLGWPEIRVVTTVQYVVMALIYMPSVMQ